MHHQPKLVCEPHPTACEHDALLVLAPILRRPVSGIILVAAVLIDETNLFQSIGGEVWRGLPWEQDGPGLGTRGM